MANNVFPHLKSVLWTRICWVFLVLSMWSSCSKINLEETAEQKSHITIDFSTFQVEVEDMSRSSRAALSTAATRLSFAVYNSNGVLVDDVVYQTSSDNGFGSVQMELYPGDYTMVAVVHNGDDKAIINSTTSVTLPGSMFTDTFAKVKELTVEPGKDSSFTMTLTRITSAFILRLLDTPPANAKEIKVDFNTGGKVPTALDINPSTGRASGNWKQTCIIPVADLGKDVPIYFIGMIKETKLTVTATAYDTEDREIISHTINDLSMIPNCKTIATGYFFQSPASGSFTLTDTWGADNNIGY